LFDGAKKSGMMRARRRAGGRGRHFRDGRRHILHRDMAALSRVASRRFVR
jgi:hypothetical protein